ncbi:MAG: AMP-binding protein [Microthrixaceae bacterium]
MRPFVEPVEGDPPFLALDAITGDADAYLRPKSDAESLAVLQFTSGSTSEPKGVMLPHQGHLQQPRWCMEGRSDNP